MKALLILAVFLVGCKAEFKTKPRIANPCDLQKHYNKYPLHIPNKISCFTGWIVFDKSRTNTSWDGDIRGRNTLHVKNKAQFSYIHVSDQEYNYFDIKDTIK